MMQPLTMFYPSGETPVDLQQAVTYLQGCFETHDAGRTQSVYRSLRVLVDAINNRVPPADLHAARAELAGAKARIAELQEDLDDTRNQLERFAADVHPVVDALAPFVDLGLAVRDKDDKYCVGICLSPVTDEYAQVSAGHLRTLLRAAGLFTDEMLPRPPNPGAVLEQAEASSSPPPATEDAADVAAEQAEARDEKAFAETTGLNEQDRGEDLDDEMPF